LLYAAYEIRHGVQPLVKCVGCFLIMAIRMEKQEWSLHQM